MKIYTKAGDKGETSLYGGKRVDKDDPRVEAYGTVDELNSAIGVVNANFPIADCELNNKKDVKEVLRGVQSDLFFIGAMLAGDGRDVEDRRLKIEDGTRKLEKMIDWMVGKMPVQKHFILPGGSRPSAQLHVARSVCRRAERRVVALGKLEVGSWKLEKILIYLNRLSDFLYTLARFVNFCLKTPEREWKSTS